MSTTTAEQPSGLESQTLTVGAAAARLGVAPATLRSWGRRYGLTATLRSDGGHRRYSTADLGRLIRMQELVSAGFSPARAAAVVLQDAPLSSADRAAARPAGTGSAHHSMIARSDARRPGGRGGPGGRVLAVPGGSSEVRGLARAISRLDGDQAIGQLGDLLVQRGVQATWDEVLRPVLVAVGQRWGRAGTGVDIEHVLSESAIEALLAYRAFLPRPAPARPVLLACSPEDLHSLPLHAVAGGLAELQVPVRMLGARVPAECLADAARRTGAAAVFVWRQLRMPELGTRELSGLPRARPSAPVVVGGPGWEELPVFARRVTDLSTALRMLSNA